MNIAICGLMPEQVRIVQQEFPKHSLRFLDLDHQRGPAIKNAAKGCDKVILMTGGAGLVSHATQDQVPPSKRLIVRGGIQKLRAELQKLPTPVRDVTPVKASMPTLPASLPTAKTQTFKRNGQTIVRNMDEIDYSVFDGVSVGDEVRIKRPSSVTLKQFDQRITAKRSNLKKHGMVTTPHKMLDGFAVTTVKALAPTKGKRVAASETAAPQPAAPVEQETATMQIAVEVQRPVAVSGAPVLTSSRESAFWQSMFIETAKQWPGAPVETIAARADEALRAYNARVGTVSAH